MSGDIHGHPPVLPEPPPLSKKLFLAAHIHEKGAEDCRVFLTCLDDDGRRWELRGHGKWPAAAVRDAWTKFEGPCEDWECYGVEVVEAAGPATGGVTGRPRRSRSRRSSVDCDFRFTDCETAVICVRCGRRLPKRWDDPSRHMAECKAAGPRRTREAKPPAPAEEQAELPPCIHRGELIREQQGGLCGLRDQVFAVFGCAVHGECTSRRICPKSKVKAVCSTCEERA